MPSPNDKSDEKTKVVKTKAAAKTKIAPPSNSDETLLNPRTNATDVTRVHSAKESKAIGHTTDSGATQPYRLGDNLTQVGIGNTIRQRFVLEKLLGVGGMGTVYRANDLRKAEAGDENSRIALKILSGEFRQHPKAFVTLQREAKKTQALAHPNIVTVYDFDREEDLVYLTMEELKGRPLADIISDENPADDPGLCLSLIKQMANGLAYAHSKGFVHSDLKPNNVMVTEEGVVKILDFGIARAAHEKSADSFDVGELGALTPRYASLEMINQAPPHSSDDIYALGIILCELLGGEHPYQNQDALTAKDNNLSPVLPKTANPLLSRLLKQAVALERDQRIASADIFLRKLSFAQTGLKRMAIVACICIAALIGNYAYIQTIEDTGIAFESLAVEQQAEFKRLIAKGQQALALNILQDAVVFFDQAYAIHATNDEIRAAIETINTDLNNKLEQAATAQQREFYQQQLIHLREYPAFSQPE